MLFSYYFLGDKLDLTKFHKQAAYYIGQMSEITYHFFLQNYKIVVEISRVDYSTEHVATVYFTNIFRDKDGDIEQEDPIYPMKDNRFKENPDVQLIFTMPDEYRGSVISSSAIWTVEKLSNLLKLLYKIESLKAFI